MQLPTETLQELRREVYGYEDVQLLKTSESGLYKDEQLRRYCEQSSDIHKKRFREFEEREAKAKEAKEKALKDKAAKRKTISKWKHIWANKKRKLASEQKEASSDDEFYDYDNLHLSFDPEKSPKFCF